MSYRLEWRTTTFNLLGILFSVNLDDIPVLNFPPLLDKTKKIINTWKRISLSPLGKITIIKTFILSNFNYLFYAIPSPGDSYTKNLNTLLFIYLWDNKPDKVKRSCVTQDYRNFGLRMVDLKSHINAIKLLWISKLIKNNHNQFSTILENSLLSISKITKLRSDWLKGFNKKIYNPFWKEVLVFSVLITFLENESITNTRELLLSPLWFNPKISKNKLFLLNGLAMALHWLVTFSITNEKF